MDATAVTAEIQEIRRRLGGIEATRESLPADAFAIRAELLDEEHRLNARLAELKEEAATAGAGFADRGSREGNGASG